MSYVIKVWEAVGISRGGQPLAAEGMFLKSYDIDAHDGEGLATFTKHRAEAMHFDTHIEAWKLWKQQSKLKPLREDGKPNRPLTAYSIMVEEL